MFNITLAAIVLIVLFVLLSVSVAAGRAYGKSQLAAHEEKLEVVTVAEGAVFTLLALLVAFAFSGAYDRFENRKLHVIDEANVVNIAYKGIDLMTPAAQPALRESIRQYLDAQLNFYKSTRYTIWKEVFLTEKQRLKHLENIVWLQTLNACKLTNDASVTQLVIPDITRLFDEEDSALELSRVHPPLAIFALLVGLAMLSGFLAGYTTASSSLFLSLHILSYIAITAFTIYIIIDLEFPRIGLIRVDSFDRILQNVRDDMGSGVAR